MGENARREIHEQLYRPVYKPGTHLADSAETEGRKRALLKDQDGKLQGPPELIPVDPEVIVVEQEPLIPLETKIEIGLQLWSDAKDLIGIGKEAWMRHKYYKEKEKEREHQKALRELELKNAQEKKEAIQRQLELEQLKAKEREAEERRQQEEGLTQEQKQVLFFSNALCVANEEFEKDMTKEEACQKVISAFLHLIMCLKDIQDVKKARIVDDETGEMIPGTEWFCSLPWGVFLQNVNNLLVAHPEWLKQSQVLMLSEAFGREFIVSGKYEPMTAQELESCLVRIA